MQTSARESARLPLQQLSDKICEELALIRQQTKGNAKMD
jgi:hypothetical protein